MDKKANKRNKHIESKKITGFSVPSNLERSFNGDSVLYNIPLYRYVYRGVFGNFGAIILLHSLFLQGLHLVHAEEILEKDEQVPKIEQVQEPVEVKAIENEKNTEDKKIENNKNEEENVNEVDTSKETLSLEDIEEDKVEKSVKDLVKIPKEELSAKSSTTLNYDVSPNKSSSSNEVVGNVEKTFPLSTYSDNSSTTKTKEATSTVSLHETNSRSTSTANLSTASTSATSSNISTEETSVAKSVSDGSSVHVDVEKENDVNNETNNYENTVNDTSVNDGVDEEQEEIVTEASNDSSEDDIVSSSSAPVNYEFVSVTKSDSEITFDKNECTELSNGSFYCYQVAEEGLTDSLFASPDQDGDLEIFLVRNGMQAQLTNNNVDDASPYFDSTTNTIVWHRLINDRYQIVSYDLNTQKETQLTHNEVNNMEPTKQGKYVVWQRWLNNSWNIVLFDGEKEMVITNNNEHNVAPHLQGNLVIWNKHSNDKTRTIEMYNIETGTYVTVNDPDGMTVDNPRMVLIYDSLQPNGEIVTKGYNIFTGEFIKLDTLPRQIPDIPDSESTTEVRALIQPKPEIKYSIEVKNTDTDTNDTNKSLVEETSTTTKEVSTNTEKTIVDEKFDLLIEKDTGSTTTDNMVDGNPSDFAHATTTSKDEINIPDLEIPPFETTTTTTENTSKNVQ